MRLNKQRPYIQISLLFLAFGLMILLSNTLNYLEIANVGWYLTGIGFSLALLLSLLQLRMGKGRAKAEERVKLMFNATPLSCILFDKDFNIIDCNQESVKLFGLSDKQEFKRKYAYLSPELQPCGQHSSAMSRMYLTKVFDEGHLRIDWMHQKIYGEPIPCKITLVRLSFKGEDVVLAYLQDMREMNAAMAQMRKALEEKKMLTNLENILNGLDAMIYVTDPKTNQILFINDKMKRHYKVKGDCVGEPCYQVLKRNNNKRCEKCPCLQLDLEPNKIVIWEENNAEVGRFYRNSDRYINWPDGKVVHLQHSIDITDKRSVELELVAAKEQAEQSNRSKSIFLASISHEIRTPMNAILGIAEIQLQEKTLPPEVEEAFNAIFDSGNLLLSIINDILDFSKIEAGKMEIAPVKYDIPGLLYDTVQLNLLRYESKPIELKLLVDENMPLDLYGDELRIKQIINNLLSNAFKYTDKGIIVITITADSLHDIHTTEGDEPEMVTLIIRISDTGQGMREDQIKRLYDAYTRFNMQTNRTTIGTGLGMSITKRFIDMMNGEISIESELGKGTTATVHLPQERVGKTVCGAELASSLRQLRFQNTSNTQKTQFMREYMPYGSVLVVDDVASNIYVAKGLMLAYGLKIETASCGLEAIEKIKNGNCYDIIFMDHMMPNMDGIETVKIIRQLGYTHPIVALTANAIIGQSEMFLDNGFDGFISKPIDSRELNASLNALIRDKQPIEVIEAARSQNRKEILKPTPVAALSNAIMDAFIWDAKNAIKVLDKMMDDKNDMDMQLYIVTVHGLKSALHNINEIALSVAANELEKAGRMKNKDVIASKTPTFITSLKALIVQHKQPDDMVGGMTNDEMKLLREKLNELKAACEAFDKKAAKAALSVLRNKTWPFIIKESLDTISEHLLDSAFKKASYVAKSTLSELN